MRSPTRVEVDSSVYLESPDDNVPPPSRKISQFNFLMVVALTNTTFVFVKKKLMDDNNEDFIDVLVFLGVINLALALLYFVFPFVRSSLVSLWSAFAKRRRQRPSETVASVMASSPVDIHQQPASVTMAPREREAPPPPYHIAVDSCTPPPSYFDIFDK